MRVFLDRQSGVNFPQVHLGAAPFLLLTPRFASLLHFQISDTGPGIAPEEMDSLFEAFSQTETGRQAQEGTGLGLPLGRKFVQLMSGDISVKSPACLTARDKGGPGTTFTFDIQVEVVDPLKTGLEPSRTDDEQYAKELVSEIGIRVVALAPAQPPLPTADCR